MRELVVVNYFFRNYVTFEYIDIRVELPHIYKGF